MKIILPSLVVSELKQSNLKYRPLVQVNLIIVTKEALGAATAR